MSPTDLAGWQEMVLRAARHYERALNAHIERQVRELRAGKPLPPEPASVGRALRHLSDAAFTYGQVLRRDRAAAKKGRTS